MSQTALPNLRVYITPPRGTRQNMAPFMAWSGTNASNTISQNFGRQGDTANIVLVDDYYATVPGYHNVKGQPHFFIQPLSDIKIIDLNCTSQPAGGVLFAGLVTNPQWHWTSVGRIEWVLNCVDYAYYADKGVGQGKYVGLHAHEIMVDITNAADCGIIAKTVHNGGHVYPGPIIPILNLTEDKLTSHWDSVTKLASGAQTYGWFVDQNRNLWWYPTELNFDSGVVVTDDPKSPVPNIYECAIDISQQMFYEWDATTFFTRCLVRGAQQTITFNLPKAKKSSRRRRTTTARTATVPRPPTQTWVANGTQASWTLARTPDVTQTNVEASTDSVKAEQASFYLLVGGVPKQVQVYDGTSAVTAPWQIIQDVNGSWDLEVTPYGSVPPQGSVLQFWYKYTIEVLAGANNTQLEHRIGGPNGGNFSEVINDSSIISTHAAYQRAKAELNEFGAPQERVDFYTSPSFLGFFRVGESFTMESSKIPNSKFNYKIGMKGNSFFVIQQMISFKEGGYRSSHIVAVRGS